MRGFKSTGYSKMDLQELQRRCERMKDIRDHLTNERLVQMEVMDTTSYFALPNDIVQKVARVARRRRVTPGRLVERWIKEKLVEAG